MITHVKRNMQRIRGFTKPSYIECAVQFRNLNPFQSFNCRTHSKKNGSYFEKRTMGLTEIYKYLDQIERMYRGYFGGVRFF